MPDTMDARDALALIERGDISASIGFLDAEQDRARRGRYGRHGVAGAAGRGSVRDKLDREPGLPRDRGEHP